MQRKILDIVPRKKPERPERKEISKPAAAAQGSRTAPARELQRDDSRINSFFAEKKSAPERKRPERPMPEREPRPAAKKPRIAYKILAGIIALGVAVFGIMTYLAKAEIIISQKSQSISVSTELIANAGSGGDLGYKAMSIGKDASTTVPSSGEQDVETKAAGTVVIYNDYSSAPYRLIKNTRLQSSNNLIFKLSDTVVVPGKKTVNGVSTPGSATVDIFADAAGPEYNVGLADFTVPGLKGYPQYSGFYARSKTAIAGGWSGKKSIASDADVAKASADLEKGLQASLEAEALSEIPDGYLLLKGTYATAFDPSTVGGGDSQASVSVHATFRGALLSKADLSRIIIQKYGGKVPSPQEVAGIESLQAAPKADVSATLASGSPLQFTLSGTSAIQSAIDPETLKKSLIGKPRASLEDILRNFPGIASAEVRITPFWETSFPGDSSKISVSLRPGSGI